VSEPFRTRILPPAMKHIQSWSLSDSLFVDVFIWLNERLPEPPSRLLVPSLERDGGMLLRFSVVDPDNRFCEHTFQFRVYYHTDEVTLLVASGTHRRQVGY
jgi:hypothetical protein